MIDNITIVSLRKTLERKKKKTETEKKKFAVSAHNRKTFRSNVFVPAKTFGILRVFSPYPVYLYKYNGDAAAAVTLVGFNDSMQIFGY